VGQKGSHIKLKNGSGITTIVKANQKIIRQGTFLDILRQTNISKKQFESIVK
jgi:predicted RNA binding protein YcfA (HicA-like mRNA interferase family)